MVAGMWRYPVKSMQGEELESAAAGERGIAGDRAWAVIDQETGKVVSAKRPKLWLTMLECAAAYVEEPGVEGEVAQVRITLPDGTEVLTDDPDRDRLLSDALGRRVTMQSFAPEGATYELRAMDLQGLDAPEPELTSEAPVGMFAPAGTYFDTSTLHMLADSTLASLAQSHPDGRWDLRRFRPNVLVAVDEAPVEGYVENTWVGHSLDLGRVQAALLAPMPRCVMTTLPQGDLPRDPLILRTLADNNRLEIPGAGVYACVGLLANVSTPGRLAVGDPVALGKPLSDTLDPDEVSSKVS
jgi:uncharacterized protein YcbX